MEGHALPPTEKSTESLPASISKPVPIGDDSDPDFDDLDDVLDQFSSAYDPSRPQNNVQSQQPTPSASGPGRPSATKNISTAAPPLLDPQSAESEDDFMMRLASEMSSVLGNLNPDPSASDGPGELISQAGKELDELTSAMEKHGINPEDLLKGVLGEAAVSRGQSAHAAESGSKVDSSGKNPTGPGSSSGEKDSFEETIRRTMERMQASDSNPNNATTEPDAGAANEEDMLANLLKAMGTSGDDGSADANSDESLSKMFLGVMEQLTNRDILYEPMKELDSKYPEWLVNNKAKLPDKDYRRYEGQREVVREIVTKFEEKGYSDNDSSCREFIWERMQKMQATGSPPEDLIASPFPDALSGAGERTGKEDDSACSTQ